MKKRKCALCSRTKARRKCDRHNHEFICSQCCAESRDSICEGCQHFTEARQYHLSKTPIKKKKHFIVEINEEVEKAVDDALALVEGGNIRKGECILEELNIRHPKNHMVNYGIGVVNALKREYDQAIECFTRATDAFPYFIEAHFNKAVAYKNKLDIKNAIKSFKEVIEIGDPQADIVRQATEFVSGLERQIMETHGIRLDQYLEAHDEFEKAFSCMEKGAWQQAITTFQKCIKLNKKHPQSYGNLGLCYAQLGQKADAIAAFDKALEIDSNYEPAMINKAVVESLQDGEKLDQESFEPIDYYRDYPLKKRSIVRSILNEVLGK